MSTIGRLFGRSPFGLLQRHMEQVSKCIAKMGEVLDAVLAGEWERIETLSEEASHLEHQADQIKDDIRNQLMRRMFLPVDRGQVLEILAIQDNMADNAEDVSVLLTLKHLKVPQRLAEKFAKFRDLNMQAFDGVRRIIGELDELIETGFGGPEAEKVRKLVHDVAYTEHQADVIQRELLRELYDSEEDLSYSDFQLWLDLIRELSTLSNLAENLADRVQATLVLK